MQYEAIELFAAILHLVTERGNRNVSLKYIISFIQYNVSYNKKYIWVVISKKKFHWKISYKLIYVFLHKKKRVAEWRHVDKWDILFSAMLIDCWKSSILYWVVRISSFKHHVF